MSEFRSLRARAAAKAAPALAIYQGLRAMQQLDSNIARAIRDNRPAEHDFALPASTADRWFVTRDGAKLHAYEVAPALSSATAGAQTVLLLHGYTNTGEVWAAQLQAVAAAGRTAIAVDLRGHGQSDPARRDRATIDQLADDIADVMAQLTGPLVVVGHSMSGMALMKLGVRSPESLPTLAGAVFISTSAGGLREVSWGLPRLFAAPLHWLNALTVNRRKARFLAGGTIRTPSAGGVRRLNFGRDPRAGAVALAHRMVSACSPVTVANFQPAFDLHDAMPVLDAFRGVSTTVLVGDLDRVTPLSHGRRLAAALPGSRLVLLPGAGHMLPLERPEEVAAAIIRAAITVPVA